MGSSLFISNKSFIKGMWSPGLRYPTALPLSSLRGGIPYFGIYDTLLPEELLSEDMINVHYQGEPVYAAFDVSRVNDATGFAAVFYSEERAKILPVLITPVYLDRAVSGNEIDQVKLAGLVTTLYRMGVNFRCISADGFASEFLIQRFKLLLGKDDANRDKAVRFSVDKNPAGHLTMLNFMKLGMYRLYRVPRLEYELENLVYDRYLGKVDHPPNSDPEHPVYWKDVTDALAAASFHLSVYENLSYEDLQVSAEVEKARKGRRPVGVGDGGPEDFYSGLADGEDFYSGVDAADDGDDFSDPMDKLMRDILP
jgi:hypothetical protein